jgi:hypothetical protein
MAVTSAKAARRYATHPPVKKTDRYPQDGRYRAVDAEGCPGFVRPRRHQLAQQVLDEDDELDTLKTQVFRELLTYMLQDPSTIEPALDLILISRHLERIGDHATNIAEDVIFMVSGARRQAPRATGRRSVLHGLERLSSHPEPDPDLTQASTIECVRGRALCVFCRRHPRSRVAAVLQRALQAPGSGEVDRRRVPRAGRTLPEDRSLQTRDNIDNDTATAPTIVLGPTSYG